MSDNGVFTIHTDGGARGNPGPAAYAYVIERPGGPDIEVGERLGEATNNVAEYTALIRALEHAKRLGAKRLSVHSDSELLVNQMNGKYQVKHPGLKPLYARARRLADEFEDVSIRHVRREYNTRADSLYNLALDGSECPPAFDGAEVTPAGPAPAQPVKRPAKKKPAAERSLEKVHKEAVAYLWSQAARWAEGDPDDPEPGEVWKHLWKMLQEHGVVK